MDEELVALIKYIALQDLEIALLKEMLEGRIIHYGVLEILELQRDEYKKIHEPIRQNVTTNAPTVS